MTPFVNIMKRHWQLISLVLLSLLVVFLLMRKPQTLTVEVEKIVTKEVVRIEYRDKVVQKDVATKKTTTRPDGTVVVIEKVDKTKTTDNTVISDVTKEKQEERTIIAPVALANYYVGISLHVLPDLRYSQPSEYLVSMGVRLGGSPIWLTTDTRPLLKQLYIGLRYEF